MLPETASVVLSIILENLTCFKGKRNSIHFSCSDLSTRPHVSMDERPAPVKCRDHGLHFTAMQKELSR